MPTPTQLDQTRSWRERWGALSLRQTLFLGAGLGILIPALALAYFQVIHKFDAEVTTRVREPMQHYADVLARATANALWNLDRAAVNNMADEVMRNADVVSITISNEHHEIFVRRQASGPVANTVLRAEKDIAVEGQVIGNLVLEFSAQRIVEELRNDLLRLVSALLAQVLISFALIWLLLDRRVLRPLVELRQRVSGMGHGDLSRPLLWQREDELGSLAKGLDSMRSDLASMASQREQHNAALAESQARFAAIFDASPVAISVSRLANTFTIEDVNGAWTRLFRRERVTVLGTDCEVNGLWYSLVERSALLQTVQRERAVSQFVAKLLPGDSGEPILCEISGQVVALGGQPHLILAYEDITRKSEDELKILALNATLEQRVLQRTSELEDMVVRLTAAQADLVRSEKLSALGSMVAGIAHELNTPIGISLTVSSTMEQSTREFGHDIAKGLTRSRLDNYVASMREGNDILLRSLHTAAGLVTSFKQVAVDQTSLNRRVFRLHETINEICITLGPTLRKTSHRIEQKIDPNIVMDSFPGPIGQTLTNLVNNALLHGFEGRQNGTVCIEAHPLAADRVRINVRDDGRGIAAAHIARVFDPFFTTKLGRGGSGLGLNIVYNLVTQSLGGSIEVQSTPGQGTCFVMTLPRVAPSAESPGDEHVVPPGDDHVVPPGDEQVVPPRDEQVVQPGNPQVGKPSDDVAGKSGAVRRARGVAL